ncbi:transposase-like protein [Streptomyces stelliscabiei]|uniref:Mutator family transposase n=1 Tax=Streptomyces stelliscabiei TaxID=146820 RepID=A0A8I0TRB5_9ACTN|nr:transposase-like protein [Streptomyces stelliscabiei]
MGRVGEFDEVRHPARLQRAGLHVKKRQKRLTGVDEMVISPAAKGLTTGAVQAHLAEVYGAEVSRQTTSTITDKVLEGMAEWQSRPLDAVYPVVFIDAIT